MISNDFPIRHIAEIWVIIKSLQNIKDSPLSPSFTIDEVETSFKWNDDIWKCVFSSFAKKDIIIVVVVVVVVAVVVSPALST